MNKIVGYSIISILAVAVIMLIVLFSSTNNKLSDTQSQLTSTQSDLVNAKSQLANTQYQLSSTQNDLTTTKQTLHDTQDNLQTTQNNLNDIQSQLKVTETNLESTQNQLISSNTHLKATQADLASVQTQLTTADNDLSQTQNALDTLKARYTNATTGYAYVLNDPTYAEAMSFISADPTNNNTYNSVTYNCYNFAADTIDNAKKQHIRCGFVYIEFPDSAHGIIAFNTTDKGLLYIEPQDDDIVHLQIGGRYYKEEVPPPGYYFPQPSYDDTVENFTVIW